MLSQLFRLNAAYARRATSTRRSRTRAVASGMEQFCESHASHLSCCSKHTVTRTAGGRPHLVVQPVLRAKGGDELLRLGKVVPRQRGEQMVLHLPVQAAGEPARSVA